MALRNRCDRRYVRRTGLSRARCLIAPLDRWKHEATAFDRVLFFSDAVFAIAVTLLVLPLADVKLAPTHVGSQLVGLIPQMVTFALSFIVTGLFWMSHRKWFQLVSAFDTRSLWVNVVFLLCVAFLPFPRQSSPSAATRLLLQPSTPAPSP